MASRNLSKEQKAAVVTAIGALVYIYPPAAMCATVGWVAQETYDWYMSDEEPKDPRRD